MAKPVPDTGPDLHSQGAEAGVSSGAFSTAAKGLSRRDLVLAGSALMLGAAGPAPFGFGAVDALARDLADRPFAEPDRRLPAALAALDYDTYRQLGFHDDRALWADQPLPFRAQFFHRGGLFPEKVEVFEVADGAARPVAYDPHMFRYGRGPLSDLVALDDPNLGFAGVRLLYPLNRADKFDEVTAFLGASYFRAVAKGGVYGASARGLAIGAGEAGEEFPRFRSFWLVRPDRGDTSLVVYALMDSASLTGAYQFTITPGEATFTDVRARLHPRTEVARVGFAPLTSMFLFDPQTAGRFDDFRPRVHDSDGLAMANGAGERLWRPLSNPQGELQASGFQDAGPRGFGLFQRAKGFSAYRDLEARYDLRPSLWVEPQAHWGEGEVRLVEIPALSEAVDNIVAEWRPDGVLRPGRPQALDYRLRWGPEPSAADLAQAALWREGRGDDGGWRRVMIEFEGAPAAVALRPEVRAGSRPVRNVVAEPNPVTGGWRLAFEFAPGEAREVELRARLLDESAPRSEVWTRRWTA